MPRPRYDRLDPDTREHILAVATEEFVAKGFHDASYNEIIRASGISKGSFYHTFEDKEDLFATVVSDRSLALWRRIDSALPARDWWGWIDRLMVELTTAALGDRAVVALWTTLYTVRSERAEAILVGCTAWMEQAIAHGQQLGEVRDDLPAALLSTLAMATGQAFDRHAIAEEMPVDAAAVEAGHAVVMDMFRRMLLPMAAAT